MLKLLPFITLLFFSTFLNSIAYDLVVAKDGSGDVETVQEAFNKVPDNYSTTYTIFIKKGIYKEKLRLINTKRNVTIVGEEKETTILTFDDYGGKAGVGGTDNSYSTLIEANDFYAENITFENTIDSRLPAYATNGQAVALMVRGDRVSFYNCIIKGFQDTFYTKGLGRIYISCCQIEGTTDFIFGAGIAVFNNCLIINKKNSHTTAAANQSIKNKYNYVFLNCKLIPADGANSVTLGRPWKPYAKVVYINCEEGQHIKPEGWSDWSSAKYDTSAYFAEYKCTGPGFNPAERISWSKQLTDQEALEYTLPNIFASNAASPAYNSDWLPTIRNCHSPLKLEKLSEKQGEISVFPNPASQYLEWSLMAYSERILISDNHGRLIINKTLNDQSDSKLDIEYLKPGIYLYCIESKNEVIRGKFIKN